MFVQAQSQHANFANQMLSVRVARSERPFGISKPRLNSMQPPADEP